MFRLVLLGLLMGASLACHSCPNDCLLAYYPFEDNAEDSSGNNRDGVETGSVTYAAGKCGRAASFDGASKVVVDDFRNFAWGSEFSVSVWFQRTGQTGNYQGIVNNGYWNTGSWEIRMGRENGGQMLGGSVVTTSGGNTDWHYSHLTAALNTWHHVVMTYDGQAGKLRYYLNGVQQPLNTLTYDAPILVRDTPVTIGQAGPGHTAEFFYGLIDEVKIFSRVLSATEVQNMANHACL